MKNELNELIEDYDCTLLKYRVTRAKAGMQSAKSEEENKLYLELDMKIKLLEKVINDLNKIVGIGKEN